MSAHGRYVELHIAATMCRSQLCADGTAQTASAPMAASDRDRRNLHIVTGSAGTA